MPDVTCDDLREAFGLTYLPSPQTPADGGMSYEEYSIPAADGALLRTWYIPTDLDRGTVVFSCGNSGPMACYLYSALLLTNDGWSVVMYDYEGFGLSQGQPSLEALPQDLEAVVEWTRARTGRQQVTLFGWSLGSIPSIAIAVERPDAVNAVILDSPVALLLQLDRFRLLLGGQTGWLASLLPEELASERLIAGLDVPLLTFLHELDPIATPETVESLFELAPEPKELVRFPDLGHCSGQFFSTDVYLYHLENFLSGVWANARDRQAESAATP